MRSNDRLCAYFQCVIECAFCSMRYVYQNTQPVHFGNHFFSERAKAAPFGFSACRVADIVAAIVAERDIADTQFFETGYIPDIFTDGITVFHTQHDCFLAGSFRYPYFLRGMGDVHSAAVYFHLAMYLVQSVHGKRRCLLQ